MAGERILVIDDDPDALFVIETLLKHNGYDVVSAESGKQGLKKALELHPQLIFLDIMMPGMDGLETCEKFKSDPATKDIPVIMITAKDTGEDVEKALAKHCDWYIAKPYDIKYVLGKVEHFLGKK